VGHGESYAIFGAQKGPKLGVMVLFWGVGGGGRGEGWANAGRCSSERTTQPGSMDRPISMGTGFAFQRLQRIYKRFTKNLQRIYKRYSKDIQNSKIFTKECAL
jgi:hypothetical protein